MYFDILLPVLSGIISACRSHKKIPWFLTPGTVMKRHKRIRDFTIIELLVSMAIILALIAILLPALFKAKQYAYKVMCMNNLKQLAFAFTYYTEENKGYWPPYLYMFSPGKSGNWIIFVKPPKGQVQKGTIEGGGGFVDPELKSVYTCPSDENPTLASFYDEEMNLYDDFPISYSYNLLLYTGNVPNFRLSNPSKLVVLFDASKLISHQGRWKDDPDFYENVLSERHNRGANHLFSDFHVEWRPEVTEDNLIPKYQ